ncbi:unnamed protein product [Dicrocoelium dendriticum]|nr:unnamed protein product [Dicrocoelium dendriticum]
MASSVVSSVKNGGDPGWMYCGVKLTIHNIIIPEERRSPTPSMLDGMDSELETELRIMGCELIQDSGVLLRLPQVAMATAQVLYQRFFYSKSFIRHFYEHYSMACIFLAAKLEECPRRIRDVINVFHHIRQVREQRVPTPVMLDQSYSNLKNQVIKAERRILKELGFCVHAKHPHKLIICYLKALEQETNGKLVQTAWNYMNDSLRTDLFVRYLPEAIACACIYLAACNLGIPLPRHPAWWEMFTVDDESVREISLCLLRLYARPKPNVTEIESELSKLRKNLMEAKEREVELKKQAQAGSTPPNQVVQGPVDVSPASLPVPEKPLSSQDDVPLKSGTLKPVGGHSLPPNSVLATAIATAKAVAANIASKATTCNNAEARPSSPLSADPPPSDSSNLSSHAAAGIPSIKRGKRSDSSLTKRRPTDLVSSGRPAAYPNVSPEIPPEHRKRDQKRKSKPRPSRRSVSRSSSSSMSPASCDEIRPKVALPPSSYNRSHPRSYRIHRSNDIQELSQSTSGSETPTSSPSPVKRRKKSYRNRSRSTTSSSSASPEALRRIQLHTHKKRGRKSRHEITSPSHRVDKYQETIASLYSDVKRRLSSTSSSLANGCGRSAGLRSSHHKASEVPVSRSSSSREHKRR